MTSKPAPADYPIHPLLQERWSPRSFAPTPVTDDQVQLLLEAARWSPSAGNLQPWRFVVAPRSDVETYDRLLGCLNESNRIWARHAPLLILAVAQLLREPGKPNTVALYDLGQAVAHLTVQAGAVGLQVHQMAGFSIDEARSSFAIPEEYQPVTALAIGAVGSPESLPESLQARELAARTRRPLAEVVFGGGWGVPLTLVAEPRQEAGS